MSLILLRRRLRKTTWGRWILGALALLYGAAVWLKNFGYQLFTTYLLPVQVTGFLLLIAMLGVTVLSRKFAEEEPK